MRRFVNTTVMIGALLILVISTAQPALAQAGSTHLVGQLYISHRSEQPSASRLLRQLRHGTSPERLGLTKATNQKPAVPTIEQQRVEAVEAGERMPPQPHAMPAPRLSAGGRHIATTVSPQVLLPSGYDPITFDECWRHQAEAQAGGWGKHHFAVCQVDPGWVYTRQACDDAGNCELIDLVSFDMTQIAIGSNGTREVDSRLFVTSVDPSDQAILDEVTLGVNNACIGPSSSTGSPECHTSDPQTQRTFRQWQGDSAGLPQTYASDASSGVGPRTADSGDNFLRALRGRLDHR